MSVLLQQKRKDKAPAKGRKLPPLSTKSSDSGPSEAAAKPRRKKKPDGGEAAGRVRERSSSRTRELPDAPEEGITSDDSAVKAAKKKMQRTRFDESLTSLRADDSVATGSDPDKPTKKKKKKTVGTSRETLMSEDTEVESQVTTGPAKKKKKKRKVSATGEPAGSGEVGLAAELGELQEDVVDTEDGEDDDEVPSMIPQGMHSQQVNKVFVERKTGFKGTDVQKLARAEAERQIRAMETAQQIQEEKTTIQFGLTTHRVFKTLTLFIQGLLAGFAAWQMTMVWVVSSNNDRFLTLLEVYSPVAMPVQAIYYLLLVVSTVSVLDRYDLSHPTRRFVIRACSLQNGAVAALIYFFALIVSLSIAFIEDKIGLYRDDPSLWADTEARDSELSRWRILNVIRSVATILGWFIISLRPNTDRLTKNLQRADTNILGLEEQTMEPVRSNGGV